MVYLTGFLAVLALGCAQGGMEKYLLKPAGMSITEVSDCVPRDMYSSKDRSEPPLGRVPPQNQEGSSNNSCMACGRVIAQTTIIKLSFLTFHPPGPGTYLPTTPQRRIHGREVKAWRGVHWCIPYQKLCTHECNHPTIVRLL